MKVIDKFDYSLAELQKRYQIVHGFPTFSKYYWRPENVQVGDGLKLFSKVEPYTMDGVPKEITTGRIDTLWEDFVEGYMRWEASIPVFPGAWHALWADASRHGSTWPLCEVDVAEQMRPEPNVIEVNFHAGGNPTASRQYTKRITLEQPLPHYRIYVYERTAEHIKIWYDNQLVAYLQRSGYNQAVRDGWLAPQFALMNGAFHFKPASLPDGTCMHITQFEYEKAGVFVPGPGPIEQPLPQPPETPMDITFKAAADEAARPNDWHLFWTLTGAPSKTVKLVVFNADTGKRLPFVTTGLAHVYVPKAWKDFEYWLEENNTIITNPIRVALPPLPPTEPPTNNKADLVAALAYTRALATNLRHNADQADLMVGILEKVVERLP